MSQLGLDFVFTQDVIPELEEQRKSLMRELDEKTGELTKAKLRIAQLEGMVRGGVKPFRGGGERSIEESCAETTSAFPSSSEEGVVSSSSDCDTTRRSHVAREEVNTITGRLTPTREPKKTLLHSLDAQKLQLMLERERFNFATEQTRLKNLHNKNLTRYFCGTTPREGKDSDHGGVLTSPRQEEGGKRISGFSVRRGDSLLRWCVFSGFRLHLVEERAARCAARREEALNASSRLTEEQLRVLQRENKSLQQQLDAATTALADTEATRNAATEKTKKLEDDCAEFHKQLGVLELKVGQVTMLLQEERERSSRLKEQAEWGQVGEKQAVAELAELRRRNQCMEQVNEGLLFQRGMLEREMRE